MTNDGRSVELAVGFNIRSRGNTHDLGKQALSQEEDDVTTKLKGETDLSTSPSDDHGSTHYLRP